MSENWASVKVCDDEIYAYEWNNIMRYGLQKTASYIITYNALSGLCEAINGETGKIDYSGPDCGAVTTAALAVAGEGATVFMKGELPCDTPIVVSCNYQSIVGERGKTKINANSAMDRLIDIRGKTFFTLDNVIVDGKGKATTVVDGNSTSASRNHVFQNFTARGGLDSCLNLSGCEDTKLYNFHIDARSGGSGAGVCDYGIKTGDNSTGGNIFLYGGLIGQGFKKADALVKDITHFNVFGTSFASHSTDVGFKANVVIDGTGAQWPFFNAYGAWWETGDVDFTAAPNILVENSQCYGIELCSCRMLNGSADKPNIYSALSPKAAEVLIIKGGLFQTLPYYSPYNVDLNVNTADIAGAQWVYGLGPDVSKFAVYQVFYVNNAELISNMNVRLANARYLKGNDATGGAIQLLGVHTDDTIRFGTGGKDVKVDFDNIDLQGSKYIKGPPTVGSCTETNKQYFLIKMTDGTIRRVPFFNDA